MESVKQNTDKEITDKDEKRQSCASFTAVWLRGARKLTFTEVGRVHCMESKIDVFQTLLTP